MKYLITFILLIINLSSFAQETIVLKKLVGNLKTIQVTINNKPYDFLFDTGGSETFISPSILSEIGKQAHGQGIGYRMNGESITFQYCDNVTIGIGALSIPHSSVGVWDIMSLLPKDFPKIDGVISLKSFSNQLITLDLINNSIIVETSSSFRKKIKRATLIQSRFANGINGQELTIFLGTVKDGITYWLLFDSGNLDNVLIAHQTAFEWGLEPADQKLRMEYSNQMISLGNRAIMSNLSSKQIIYDGALSFETLSQFQFYIDLRNKQVWIK